MGIRRGPGRPSIYKASDGKRVPSVTTILGRFKESGGLVRWAYNMGLEGKDMDGERDNAASAGSLTHDMIEADILGIEPKLATAEKLKMTDEEYVVALERARFAFSGFRKWRQSVNMDVTHTEWPLVSDRHRFGGTIDAIGYVAGELAVIDWKSSNRAYADYIVQVAAYRQLWEEHNPEPIQTIHLLRVGKEYGDWHHHSWPIAILNKAWRMFEIMREAYDIDSVLKKVAA